jgi:hypothetical protein
MWRAGQGQHRGHAVGADPYRPPCGSQTER